MVKDDNTRIMITLTKKEYASLEKYSNETGFTKSLIIRMALLEKLSFENMNPIRWNKPE